MEIENTPIWSQALEILYDKNNLSYYGWEVIIHLNNDLNEVLVPMFVNAVSIRRDYCNAYADEVVCNVSLPIGKYVRRLYPNRDHLDITLSKYPLKGTLDEANLDYPIQVQRYTAVLADEDTAVAQMQAQQADDEFSLDVQGFKDVSFQLINKAVERARVICVGGIFRNTTTENLIKSIITKETSTIAVDSSQAIIGNDFIESDNKKKFDHICITHGLKLFDLPNYIQNRYGVYSSGLGSYVQNQIWHIFPMYDSLDYYSREKTFTIILIPKKKMPETEKSFILKGDSLTILVTGEMGYMDDSSKQLIQDGNGSRFGASENFLDSYSQTKDNITSISRKRNNSEFITDIRQNEINNTPVTGNRITSNAFAVYSNILSRSGGYFKCTWQHSDPSYLLPGMQCRIIYMNKDDIDEKYAVLLGTNTASQRVGDFSSKRHVTNTLLHLFIGK